MGACHSLMHEEDDVDLYYQQHGGTWKVHPANSSQTSTHSDRPASSVLPLAALIDNTTLAFPDVHAADKALASTTDVRSADSIAVNLHEQQLGGRHSSTHVTHQPPNGHRRMASHFSQHMSSSLRCSQDLQSYVQKTNVITYVHNQQPSGTHAKASPSVSQRSASHRDAPVERSLMRMERDVSMCPTPLTESRTILGFLKATSASNTPLLTSPLHQAFSPPSTFHSPLTVNGVRLRQMSHSLSLSNAAPQRELHLNAHQPSLTSMGRSVTGIDASPCPQYISYDNRSVSAPSATGPLSAQGSRRTTLYSEVRSPLTSYGSNNDQMTMKQVHNVIARHAKLFDAQQSQLRAIPAEVSPTVSLRPLQKRPSMQETIATPSEEELVNNQATQLSVIAAPLLYGTEQRYPINGAPSPSLSAAAASNNLNSHLNTPATSLRSFNRRISYNVENQNDNNLIAAPKPEADLRHSYGRAVVVG